MPRSANALRSPRTAGHAALPAGKWCQMAPAESKHRPDKGIQQLWRKERSDGGARWLIDKGKSRTRKGSTYMNWPVGLPVWRYVAVGGGSLSPVRWHGNWMCSDGGVLWGGQQGSCNGTEKYLARRRASGERYPQGLVLQTASEGQAQHQLPFLSSSILPNIILPVRPGSKVSDSCGSMNGINPPEAPASFPCYFLPSTHLFPIFLVPKDEQQNQQQNQPLTC